MPLQIEDVDHTTPDYVGEWRFGPQPVFMPSSSYETLARELRRYLRREVSGRSFLIAAHRGVGKTALVNRVTSDLYREAVRGAGSVLQSFMQRPLLVKLHGSTLMTTPRSADSLTPNIEKPAPSVEAALQQITIALYRALAAEIAQSFTRHAYEQTVRQAGSRQLLELAAQLTLDLDLAPDPAGLRAYWARLGRLQAGVAWPSQAAQPLARQRTQDPGLAEIIALVTANQAFQVCVGSVAARQTATGSAERNAAVEAAGRIDVREAADRLFALAAGVLTGGALLTQAGPALAAAAGLAAATLSAATLGWSANRRQGNTRDTDYTFIVDRSLKTLDRDLPVVIERIRDAGLAPVFLIDELDKLPAAAEAIECIVRRLKNLTTDYGFFCFATDRSYFEAIESKVRTVAYPTEHTYFSHRLLLMYRPAELARYVRQLLVAEPSELAAAWVLTCIVLHRARLNMKDVGSVVSAMSNDARTIRPAATALISEAQYLVPMAVQLAIEDALRHPDIRAQMDTDSAFAQLAQDVLYFISRAWESGARKVTISEDAVKADLKARRGLGPTEADENAASAEDIERLTRRALGLAHALTQFSSIAGALYGQVNLALPTFAPPYQDTTESERAKLAALAPLLLGIPGVPDGLLMLEPGSGLTLRFQFDRYGVPYRDDKRTLEVLCQAVTLIDGLLTALGTASSATRGLDLAALIAAGVLPASLKESHDFLTHDLEHLRPVRTIPQLEFASQEAIDRLTGLSGAISAARRAIVVLTAMISTVIDRAEPYDAQEPRAPAVLAAIDRMIGIAPLTALFSGNGPEVYPLKLLDSPLQNLLLTWPPNDRGPRAGAITAPDTPTTAAEWDAAIGALIASFNTLVPPQPGDRWKQRLQLWFAKPFEPLQPPIYLEDIAAAAMDSLPATWIRPDLRSMSVEDWSRLAQRTFRALTFTASPSDVSIAGANQRIDSDPVWLFGASLRALGFDKLVVEAASPAAAPQLYDPMANNSPGVLREFTPGLDIDVAEPPAHQAAPVFAVPKPDRDAYIGIVSWLFDHNALAYATTPKEAPDGRRPA